MKEDEESKVLCKFFDYDGLEMGEDEFRKSRKRQDYIEVIESLLITDEDIFDVINNYDFDLTSHYAYKKQGEELVTVKVHAILKSQIDHDLKTITPVVRAETHKEVATLLENLRDDFFIKTERGYTIDPQMLQDIIERLRSGKMEEK